MKYTKYLVAKTGAREADYVMLTSRIGILGLCP
jgi:hypothetical protein